MSKGDKSRVIDLDGARYRIIPLNEPLREDVMVFPGDPLPKKKVYCNLETHGCNYNIYTLGDHVFHPHGDAPKHHADSKRGFEFFGLRHAFNNACMIDISDDRDNCSEKGIRWGLRIKKYHLTPFEKIISKRGALVIRTGYDKKIEKNSMHFKATIPYIERDAAKYLAGFKNLNVIGTDSLTIDPAGKHDSHKFLMDKLVVESLVNLYSIPLKNRDCFGLETSPIAIVGATGGPIAANAFIRIK